MPVVWNAENDRKLLLHLIMPASKIIPIDFIASTIPGATPKAIIERISKIRREKKATVPAWPDSDPSGASPKPSSNTVKAKGAQDSIPTATDSPPTKAQRKGGKRKNTTEPLLSSTDTMVSDTPTKGRKRGRVVFEEDSTTDYSPVKRERSQTLQPDHEEKSENAEETEVKLEVAEAGISE